ncbi:5-oxoprolinase subunit C family protein [Gracilibacillus timonensis]|uniref:5-oxoprolinase subunit C family protein n=1 Tax=Gracilibacillus timonensis TaxID=1816696 RepID=UPI0008262EFD|nr:biotin-dependent carboxyltransferase family protein [Gracilibacillus timonensis]
MTIEVIEAGLHSTIQDAGRSGYQSYGFSLSGPMDEYAAQLANILVGNPMKQELLELSFIGPTLQFHHPAIIAITGADMSANLNQQPIQLGRPIQIMAGDTLQLRTAKVGTYSYIAVKNGFEIPTVLGSKSMVVRTNITGLLGSPLAVGDMIPCLPQDKGKCPFHWGMDSSFFSYITNQPQVIRYLEGAQTDWFPPSALENKPWKISTTSNRMGYRLQGEAIAANEQKQLATEATSFGAIQIPANGQPIILMADGQPTGGYPKIGQVIRTDLATLSQIQPGCPFYFKKVSLAEAIRKWKQRQYSLGVRQKLIREKWKEEHL